MKLVSKLLLSALVGFVPMTTLADDNVSNVSANFEDTTLSTSTSLTVTFTTASTVAQDDGITFALNDGTDFNADMDFTLISVGGGTLESHIDHMESFENGQPGGPSGPTVDGFSLKMASDLDPGTYTVILDGITTPSVESELGIGLSTLQSTDFSAFTPSNLTSFADPVPEPTFDVTALLGLKVKEIKKFSAKLKWDAYVGEDAVFYKVKLMNKKGKELKTFKNVQSNTKQIKKSTELLQPGKTYKFKVKACQVADPTVCTDWSANKKFTTKAAE